MKREIPKALKMANSMIFLNKIEKDIDVGTCTQKAKVAHHFLLNVCTITMQRIEIQNHGS